MLRRPFPVLNNSTIAPPIAFKDSIKILSEKCTYVPANFYSDQSNDVRVYDIIPYPGGTPFYSIKHTLYIVL